MTYQPPTGLRDLNPQQVEENRILCKKLSHIFSLWGYEEVSPPRVERLNTLNAAGAIKIEEIVKVVADEPLGLRPEMTASIARAACSRLANKPRPLRLWASGTVFECKESAEGGLSIEENLQIGIELIGVKGIAAEMEILTIIIQSLHKIKINTENKPTLLIGHTSLIELVLSSINIEARNLAKEALLDFNLLKLARLDIPQEQISLLKKVQECRGYPSEVIAYLNKVLGKNDSLEELERLFNKIEKLATEYKIDLQLDPTFQPHFDLYTGIVFQVACLVNNCPQIIARGGRYDQIIKKFGDKTEQPAGAGFSLSVDKLREMIKPSDNNLTKDDKILICFKYYRNIETAFERQSFWHLKEKKAEIELNPVSSYAEALKIQKSRNCAELEWIDG